MLLQGNKFTARAFCLLDSGEMLFGGPEGLTAFEPQYITANPYAPPVVLTDFRLFNKSIKPSTGEDALLKEAITYADLLKLSHKDYVISFEFAALSYALPEKNRYAYKLENFEEDWNYTTANRRFATYTSLPAGEYTFRVKAANNDGVWNEEGTALKIVVLPAWWETFWFRGAVLVLIGGLLFGGYRWRVYAIERQRRELETEVAERTEDLRESEERFATVMNSMRALMYVADIQTYELLFVNQYTRSLFGDVEGQICWQVLQKGQEGPCEFCTNEHLIENGEPRGVYTWEFQNTVTDRWYHIQDRAIRWIDGRWVRMEVATDITEQKRVEEQLHHYATELKRSNEDLQQFSYVISHDLQEPLRMVTSYMKLLERRYKDSLDEDARDFIWYAADGATRMQRMIKDLLAYSRLDTRGAELTLTNCEELLEQAMSNLSVTIKESGAVITHDALPKVLADSSQLYRVFQNLISNAIKFRGDEAPRVHISAKERADDWLFSVRDNGIGIDPQQMERIFVIFQRLHTRNEYAGTGIGLATCKKIVERHGGQIWVESEPGAGATFYFTIPR